MQQIFIGNQ